MNKTIASGYIILALAVMIGAFGAHGLEGVISDKYLETYKTANFYHFIHGIAMILSSHLLKSLGSKRRLLVTNLFLLGMILFSGSLYLLSLNEYFEAPELRQLGAVTPVGGVLFILGWLIGAWEILQNPKEKES